MYNLILVPLDGSRFAESALPLALTLSRQTKAGVHLVSVQEILPAMAPNQWEAEVRGWHERYLEDLVHRIQELAGGEVTAHVRSGHVADSLQSEASEKGADLVVMATHGRGTLTRAWMGSVADSFIRHADRPVLLVRPQDSERLDLQRDWTLSKILIAMDGTEVSEEILEHAVELGRIFDATYLLIRVVPFPRDLKSSYPPHMIQMNREILAKEHESASNYLSGHARLLVARGLTVDNMVVDAGQAGHGIVTEAEESRCDLIAMSTHGRGAVARKILGSTADKVVRGARIPVLLYRPRH